MNDRSSAAVYEIRLQGVLGASLLAAFPALRAESHNGITVLTGSLPDQAALFGVLAQIESLALEVLAVQRMS